MLSTARERKCEMNETLFRAIAIVGLIVVVFALFCLRTELGPMSPAPEKTRDMAIPSMPSLEVGVDPNREIAKTCTEEALASALKKIFSGDSTYIADLAAAELFAGHAGIDISQQVLELKRLGVPREVLGYFNQAAISRNPQEIARYLQSAKMAAKEIGLDVNSIADAIQQAVQTRASNSPVRKE